MLVKSWISILGGGGGQKKMTIKFLEYQDFVRFWGHHKTGLFFFFGGGGGGGGVVITTGYCCKNVGSMMSV